MGSHQFAGPTQLLSASGNSKDQIAEAASSMASAVGLALPSTGTSRVKKDENTFNWKEFRTPTKQVLCGLANSLQQVLPDGFNLRSARPSNLLAPAGPDGKRYLMTAEEVAMHGFSEPRYFTYNEETHECAHDSYLSEDFYRLALSADEGTEDVTGVLAAAKGWG